MSICKLTITLNLATVNANELLKNSCQILLASLLCIIPCDAAVGSIACTSSDSVNCTKYGNSKCVSDTCLCKDDYYDNESTCQQKGTHGEACSSTVGDSSCLHSLKCTSDVCSCTTPSIQYFDPADNTCKSKGTHGEACSSTVGDSSCLHFLKCTSDVCSCTTPSTQYFDPADNTCKSKGTHGEACSSTVGDSSCLHSLKCTSDICSCTIPSIQYLDPADNTCKSKGTHGEACSSTVGDSSCLHFLKCTSDVCSCTTPSTQYFDPADNTCKSKGTHGEACSSTVGDSSCLHSLKCTSDVCSCTTPSTQYFDPADNTCKSKGTHGEACSSTVGDSSCLHSLKCTSDVCSCTTPSTQYFELADNTCKSKGTHGEACSSTVGDSSCLHSLKCTSDVCSCTTPSTQYFDPADNTCKSKGTHGESCSSTVGDSSCLHSLKCTSDVCCCTTPSKQYFDLADNTCKSKGTHGEACSSTVGDSSCLHSLKCTSDVCSCTTPSTQYFELADNTCKSKGTHGEACSSTVGDSSCLHSLKCTSDVCSCTTPSIQYFDPADNTCKSKGTHGESCSSTVGDSSCLHSLKCTSDVCCCTTPSKQYFDLADNTCKSKGTHGEACPSTVGDFSCLHSLKCTSDVCSCTTPSTQYFDPADNTCKSKKPLGDNCSADFECLVANAECTTKCQCKINYYDTNNAASEGACEPLVNLRVSNIQLQTRSENYLVIKWTAPPAAAAVEEYKFVVGGTSSEVSVGKQLEANITGLIPGVMYTITVISVDSDSRPAQQKTSPGPVNQATKPATPGPIKDDSDLTASDGQIIVKWGFTGTVALYTVTISDLITMPVNTSNTFFGINSAKNGHRYTLKLTAHSNGLISDEYSEVFRTVITQPNPPTSLSCAEIVSTSIDLEWQPSALPNGDIQYYLIDTSGPFPPSQINTSTSVVTYKVEPLLAANRYCFFVKTVNDGPDSIKTSGNSNQLCCTTKAASSSEPTSVTINVLSSRHISVSWNYPDNPQGDIFGYRLRLRVNAVCQVEIIFFCTDCPNTHTITYKDCGDDKQRQTVNLIKNQINTTISYVVGHLIPYTNYDVWIAAHSTVNDGLRHESKVQTISEVPQTPLSLTASVVSSSQITVTWNQPAPRPGVTTYHVKAYEVVNDVNEFVKMSNVSGFSIQTTTFSGLEAYWNYTFSVVAATDKGNSEQSEMSGTVTTHQDAPGKVTNFEIKRPANIFTTMEVTWTMPSLRDRNGIIKEYKISHNISGTFTIEVVTAEVESFQKLYYITPDRYYMIELYAVNNLNQDGEKNRKIYYASSRIESQPPVSHEGYSIETVIGAVIGCVSFSVVIMVIVVCFISKRKKNKKSKQSKLRHTQDVSQIGDQYEELGMNNISHYQELGSKENQTVYDQIDRMQTLDKQYENLMLKMK
ncbi:unnamed protein product [Mytilus coruscus]|uniref:Fibronectin type-III domain-containing protein n=1 Tax=Mytilus coruscus TaxID=42192 RepID=A0A6J8B8T2_MYTCO|nr:unnamed protein product [Mytilus coruscus]